jgi:uncharacterized protein (TIGR03382 family)
MLTLLLLLSSPTLAAPSGYDLVTEGRGVSLWRQVVDGGEPDFVVEVDLDVASLQSVIDPIGDSLDRHSAASWWTTHTVPRQFATINGAFFAASVTPTSPAFGLRTPSYIHAGYGTNTEYTSQQVSLWLEADGGANITPADPSALTVPSNPDNQIVALTTDANKGPNSWVPRTFLGLKDSEDNAHRTALLFVSKLATQAYAEGELDRWGATQQIMLDGGSSAHLVVQGTAHVQSGRAIPHLIRVVEGPDTDGDTDTEAGTDPDTDAGTDTDTDSDADSDTVNADINTGCSTSGGGPNYLGVVLLVLVGLRTRK